MVMNVLAITLNDVILLVAKCTNEVIWRDSGVGRGDRYLAL